MNSKFRIIIIVNNTELYRIREPMIIPEMKKIEKVSAGMFLIISNE